jgi:hypothetical protein
VSRRLEFEERAAVLEFDGGLRPAEAEQRALADIYHELSGCRGRARGILDELIRADARRRAPALECEKEVRRTTWSSYFKSIRKKPPSTGIIVPVT